MIGVVNARLEAVLPLAILLPGGGQQLVTALIDTGYTGAVTLPPETIAALGLVWHSKDQSTLADGSVIRHDVYLATLNWDGVLRPVFVDEAESEPLIGMQLLAGHDVCIAVEPGGRVALGPLPPRGVATGFDVEAIE